MSSIRKAHVQPSPLQTKIIIELIERNERKQNEMVVCCLLVFASEEVKQQPLQNHGLPLAKFVHQSSVPTLINILTYCT